jgi:hypothetical protein
MMGCTRSSSQSITPPRGKVLTDVNDSGPPHLDQRTQYVATRPLCFGFPFGCTVDVVCSRASRSPLVPSREYDGIASGGGLAQP